MKAFDRLRNGIALAAMAAAIAFAPAALAREITPAEMQALSPICQAAFGKDLTQRERLAPFAHQLTGSCGIHHTCNGELAMIRYRSLGLSNPGGYDDKARAKQARHRKGLLQAAVNEYGFEARCGKPGYPLLPMIHTERGKASSLLGQRSPAMKDFTRALELDPEYAPARHALAAAQARVAAPTSSK